MAVKGKGKQLASDPPGGSGSGSKRRGDAGPSSSLKAAAKHVRRPGVLQFFDHYVAVGDEYEEQGEEEERESEEDFDDDDDGFVTEELRKGDNNIRSERSHPLPFLGHVKEEELSGDELEEFIKERYSSRVRYAGYGGSTQYDYDADNEFTHLNEPIIWRVKCMVGRERQMAFLLMQKFVDLQKFGTKLPIISAFSLDHVREFVFVEAEKVCDVTEACKGFYNVYVNRSSPIPAAEFPSLLSPRAKPSGVSPGTWVRMKAGNYKGDLAQVIVGADDMRKRVLIKLVPRVDLRAISKKFGGAISLKEAAVPAPRLISSQELELLGPHIERRRDRQTGDVSEVLDSLMLKDGFLYKRVALSSLIYWGIQPTDTELVKFSSSPSTKTSADDMDWRIKATVATNVTVDLEYLDCTVCFGPLKPPVFQCASGHVLCSICYEKLLEKEKCQACSITTGYNRCFAMERVLQSLQVLCSNARNGCTAKMPYYEMEEHEKECPKAVCDRTGSNAMQPTPLHQCLSTDCYTLVIPKVSPSTSINISLNNGEAKKKIHDNKNSTDSVVKMGPCGGIGGNSWKMDMRGVNRIVKVVVRHGGTIDAMSVFYVRDNQEEESKLWGGTGGIRSEISLKPDEYLTSVKGHYGFFNNCFVIRSLTFVSNRRNFGPYGTENGVPFKLPAAGGKIIGFHGRSYGLLDALGTYVQMG